MKKYNIQNYIRYKEDVKKSMPPTYSYHEYTRNELIVRFMPLVENLARKFSTTQQASGVLSINDLLQIGNEGLIKAVDKLDWEMLNESEDVEKTLKSFLSERIKGNLRRRIDMMRGDIRIPEHKLNEIRKNPENKAMVAMFFNSVFLSIDTYAENPQLTTVLVLNYKYKKLDKRKKLCKAIAKSGLLFESKKLYENQVSDWIRRVLSGKKYQIEPKASQMLVEFLGADLSKISNELDKLLLILPKERIITASHIEDNIGISKDFNNFELRKSLGEKNIVKANRIINYFSENPKNNPLVMTISLLNSFFTQLLMFHALQDKSKNAVAKAIGVSPYFVDEYFLAARNYPMRKVASIIALLRQADVKSKGVGANQSQNDILKELLFTILH